MQVTGLSAVLPAWNVSESASTIEPGQLQGIGTIPEISGLPQTPAEEATQPSFTDVLSQAIGKVNSLQTAADREAQAVATGAAPDLHTAAIAMERAEIAFQTTVQVTQKAIDAYKEISRMQL